MDVWFSKILGLVLSNIKLVSNLINIAVFTTDTLVGLNKFICSILINQLIKTVVK